MAKPGRKPTLPEKRIVAKIYLDRANHEFLKSKKNRTEYLNQLIERDRLENERSNSEGLTSYPVKGERLIKG